jgi:outer membrane lipoprotein-sorting protein
MNRLRRTTTARLLVAAAALVLVAVVATVASAALRGGASAPQSKPLDQAVQAALSAQHPAGVTADISFTNALIPNTSSVAGSASALLNGATGRLWATADGRFRLELQSNAGDTQIVHDASGLFAYDTTSNTLYRLNPSSSHEASGAAEPATGAKEKGGNGAHGLAQIDKELQHLGKFLTLSNAQGTTVAGRSAYVVKVMPSHSGGLIGRGELAWDALNGTPLRIAVYAQGNASPVLELKATNISFGPVASSDVVFTPPANAKVVDVKPPSAPAAAKSGSNAKPVTGVAAVKAAVPFTLAAPDSLVGLPRQDVRLVSGHDGAGALLVYGKGLGAIFVLQRAATANGSSPLPSGLPQVSINGATGTELATALGTAVSFQHGGVSYLVAGSVPPVAAEHAARTLASS